MACQFGDACRRRYKRTGLVAAVLIVGGILLQDFPYNFEDSVEHHNIWSTIPLTKAAVIEVREDGVLSCRICTG